MAAKRYVLVGSGGRGINMFGTPIVKGEVEGFSELVGLFDSNTLRMKAANELMGVDLPAYTDFDKMLAEVDPDGLIIATKDNTHCEYIVKGLAAGKRILSEKPLCTTADQCRQILEAQAASSAEGFCTHNVRYVPAREKMKEIVKSGQLGKILTIQYDEMLDRRHGADYFRRWHRNKADSGGLLIHKSSHHFDFINWLADSLPDVVTARGDVSFYGKNCPFRSERCLGCAHEKECDLYVDMFKAERSDKLYHQAEPDDGYYRDGCVFDESIDTEDRATVIYNYKNGIHVTYNLIAFASFEGERIYIEGTKARLEAVSIKSTQWAAGDATVFGMEEMLGDSVKIFEPKGGVTDIEIEDAEGTHGGSDPKLRAEMLGRDWSEAPTESMAPLEQAIQAVMVGAAANESIAKGGVPVDVQALLKG